MSKIKFMSNIEPTVLFLLNAPDALHYTEGDRRYLELKIPINVSLIALRTAKTLLSFGRSECNRVK